MGLADFTDNVETSWGRGCIISYTLHPHIMAGLSSSPIWVPQLWKVPNSYLLCRAASLLLKSLGRAYGGSLIY